MSMLDDQQQEWLDRMNATKVKMLPDNHTIVGHLASEHIGEHDIEWIKMHVSDLVVTLEGSAYDKYLEYEEKAGLAVLESVAQDAGEKWPTLFPVFDKFFQSLAQGRKPRAGNSLLIIVESLLRRLGYQMTSTRQGLVLPSEELRRAEPRQCVLLKVKRTIRERWKLLLPAGREGLPLFLATIDRDITQGVLKEIKQERVTVVVPAMTKQTVPLYRNDEAVLSYESFVSSVLDPRMPYWLDRGQIDPVNRQLV